MRMRVFLGVVVCLASSCVDTELTRAASAGSAGQRAAPWADAGGTRRPPFAAAAQSVDAAAADSAAATVDAVEPSPPSAAGSNTADDAGMASEPHRAGSPDAGQAEPPLAPGAVVISELMIDPKSLSDAQGEWIELYNPGSRSTTLQGCELDDGGKTPRTWMPSLRLPPGAYATIARQPNPGFTPDATAAISLTNSGDTLALRCRGVEIDRVTYSKSAGYPLESGASLSLDPARLEAAANDEASAWCAGQQSYGPELGSPGQPNPPCHDAHDASETEDDAGAADDDEGWSEPESARARGSRA